MKLYFHTNIDEAQHDVINLNKEIYDRSRSTLRTPNLPVPRKGELVQFNFLRASQTFYYELEVRNVLYDYRSNEVKIELHIPLYLANHERGTIAGWSKWFVNHRYSNRH